MTQKFVNFSAPDCREANFTFSQIHFSLILLPTFVPNFREFPNVDICVNDFRNKIANFKLALCTINEIVKEPSIVHAHCADNL